MGEPGSSYKEECLSWDKLQVKPWYDTWRARVANTIQCGGRKCVTPLAITDGGGQSVHIGWTGAHSGTELEGFLCRL